MEKRKIWMLGAGAFLVLTLLCPNVLAGYSNTTHIAGYYGGEYPYGYDPACHPEISSLEQYVAIVFVSGSGNNAQIRMAYSSDYGNNFAYDYVNIDPLVRQDYPDVKIYMDTTDSNEIKAVVVWQQKPIDDSEEWEIKAREWSFISSSWVTSVLSVSETSHTEDDNDNIYPKVSACSDNSVSYWNIVWQRDWDGLSNRYGIYLRKYTRDTSTEAFNPIYTIAYPNGWDDDYKHPALDCIPSVNYYEIVYVVYDEFHQGGDPDNIIKLTYGSPSGSAWGQFSPSGNTQVTNSTNGDLSQDFPDIAVVESADGNDIIVDCVWIENEDDNDRVFYARSSDGGQSIDDDCPFAIDDGNNGCMELRAVAIDMCVTTFLFEPYSHERCHVIWTSPKPYGNRDVYYWDRLGSGGDWDELYICTAKVGANMVEFSETFVDASTSSTSPSVIKAYATWQVQGTAVFFGTEG